MLILFYKTKGILEDQKYLPRIEALMRTIVVFRVFKSQCELNTYYELFGLPGGTVVKNPPAGAGDIRDTDLILGLGRSAGAGHGDPLQYSCLENPMDRGAWQSTVHGVPKSQTQLSE